LFQYKESLMRKENTRLFLLMEDGGNSVFPCL
jgi:hypothetical protein